MGIGRGNNTWHRPVLAARVNRDLYERLKAASATSGRSPSEEMVHRVHQSFEAEDATRIALLRKYLNA